MTREARKAAHRLWSLCGRPGSEPGAWVCDDQTSPLLHCGACCAFANVLADFVSEYTKGDDD